MDYCLKINYICQIIIFLKPKEIVKLSLCNKTLNEILSPINNNIINTIFMFTIMDRYFNLEESNYNEKNKKNLLGKNPKFCVDMKLFLKQFLIHFGKYKKEISARVQDFFRIHIYLPDLRKEIFNLEYENSSINMLFHYDINSRLIHTYNYYSKYINFENVIQNSDKKNQIKILREKLNFESCIINFYSLFQDYVNNKGLCDFVKDDIINYNYENLDNMYITENFYSIKSDKNNELNDLFLFLLWINHMFILYCQFNYAYIEGLIDNVDDEELLTEFITKKNDLINCALLINSTFDNVNIVINLLNIFKEIFDSYISHKSQYLSLSQCSSSDSETNAKQENQIDTKKYYDKIISPFNKFLLYNLFLKNIDNYYTKKLEQIIGIFKNVTKNYFLEAFTVKSQDYIKNAKKEDKMDIEEDADDELINEIKSEDDDDDDDLSMDIKLTKKELVENTVSAMVDCSINNYNANGIMHTNFKVDNNYITKIEKNLIDIFLAQITKSINEDKMPLAQCFDIVESITGNKGNSKSLYLSRESLVIIRRTKKPLMEKSYYIIFAKLMELITNDFCERFKKDKDELYLTAVEKIRSQDYKCDLEALTEDGEDNVKKNVEKDYQEIEKYLLKKSNFNTTNVNDDNKNIDNENQENKINNNNGKSLAQKYLECVKIDYILLLKKLMWNYYKQLEIYKERDSRVEYYLKNNIGKYKNEFEENNINEKAIDIKQEKNPELWNRFKIKEAPINNVII